MPNVDGFAEFVAEEVRKDFGVGLTIYAPADREIVWEATANGREGAGDTLGAAINQLSQRLDYTSKDIRHDEEPSLVKRVAELARKQDSPLVITLTDTGWDVTVPIDQDHYSCAGYEVAECLRNMLDNLLGETND